MKRSAWSAIPLVLATTMTPSNNVRADSNFDFEFKGDAQCEGNDLRTYPWTMVMMNGDKPIHGVSRKNGEVVTTDVDMSNYTMPNGQPTFDAPKYVYNVEFYLPNITESAVAACKNSAKDIADNSHPYKEPVPVKVHRIRFNFKVQGLEA